VVFIQRLALPHVYPFPELLICLVARLFNKRVVFDFDDAIFTTYPHRKKTLVEKFTDSNRVARIVSKCDAVIAGNQYLAHYARTYNHNVWIIPTTIDTVKYPVKVIIDKVQGEPFIIGWIGTPSSLPYLDVLKPALQEVAKRFNIVLRIIGGQNYHCPGVRVECFPWSLENEVPHLLTFDLGVMPLAGHEFARGKCGLKLLQYMAAGLPAIGSPVGVNKEIITDGFNGYLASCTEEWVEKISNLIQSTPLRCRMGRMGRETVEQEYSVQVNIPKLISILKGTVTLSSDNFTV